MKLCQKLPIIGIFMLSLFSFAFSNCADGTDVCLSLDGGNLNYNSSVDIAGFQFGHDGCVTGAAGGDAAANGFTTSASGTVVLAFSFTGSVIPAGEGTLVVLDGDITEDCLSAFVFSDSAGGPLVVNWSETVTGCMDDTACNFNADAETDDGSCWYVGVDNDYCDCDMNMNDCAGECGGSAMEDCIGECNGSAIEDECGVCDGDGTTCDYGCVDGVEVCLSLDGGNLNYSSTVDVAGFQFSHNGCVTGASGGDAESNGFTVSASGSAVLAFSFTGSVVPAGAGTLVELAGDVSLECLSDFIFSDAEGVALIVDFPVVMIDGCTDTDACNYDMDANSDDGSCTYPEENYDCDGNCTADLDCNGDCGGTAVEDECGICEGDGSLCTVGLSLSIDDSTGNMLVHMSNAMDVAGFQFEVSNIIINSASGGTSAANGFSVSTSPTSSVVLGFSFTGDVIPPGDAVLVELDYTATWNESCISNVVLSDVVGGGIDYQIGDCVTLDYTVVEGCMDSDACNYNMDANSDDGSCSYPEENYDCDGNCAVDIDCEGACGGNAIADDCGECGGDNSTCTGCMDDSALNYDADATIDCDGCCEYPTQVNIGVSNVSNDGVVEIHMTNITDVAGFQFELLSTCDVVVNSGYGGSADESGFTISTSPGGMTVLGFSLTGGVIAEGSGTLLFLDTSFDCSEGMFGLENAIISDISGSSMTVTVEDHFEYTSGCQDETASNYGEEGDCLYNNYYNVSINPTGASHLVAFLDTIEGLESGDEIGLFDTNGVLESCIPDEGCDTDNAQYGEVLVGAGVWDAVSNAEGTVTSVVGIMSQDLSDFNGPILNGAVDGSTVVVRIYDVSEGVEYSTTLTTTMGGSFGDMMTVIDGISLEDEDLSNDTLNPSGFGLLQNYPNPFNPQTMIQFSVPNFSDISLNIYDLNGKLIDVVAEGVYSQGAHSVIWNGMNLNNEAVSSGVYLYKLITPNETITKQLTLIR